MELDLLSLLLSNNMPSYRLGCCSLLLFLLSVIFSPVKKNLSPMKTNITQRQTILECIPLNITSGCALQMKWVSQPIIKAHYDLDQHNEQQCLRLLYLF